MADLTRERTGGGGPDDSPSLPRRILRALVAAEKALGVALLFVILVLVVAQVVMRFVFERPLFWSDELARYCYVWLSFIAAVAVTAGRSHVRIDVINHFLPPLGQRLVELLASLVVIGTCTFLVYGSWEWLQTTIRPVSPALRLQMVYVYGVVWLAFAAMALHGIVNVALFLAGRQEPAESADAE
jgi:TRAP-type transport system small permease protein